MNEIEYGEIDWEDVFLTMEAEIKQLRKENEQLKAQMKSKKTVVRPDYFSRSDNYLKLKLKLKN